MRLYGVLIVAMLPQTGWAMEYRVSAGTEAFLWEEYDASGGKLLDEAGLRHFVAFDADNWLNRNWQSDFRAKVYSGSVEYNGETVSGAATQSTDTDYDGLLMEAGFSYFPDIDNASSPNAGRAGIRMAVGFDSWRRSIQDSRTVSLTPTEVPGYVENYTVAYGRLGATFGGGGNWSFDAGAKYPFYTSETVGLKALGYASDPTLKPQGRFSLYADVGIQFNRWWSMQFYYDSYRFARSGAEPVYYPGSDVTYLVWQPESRQDAVGVKVSFTF